MLYEKPDFQGRTIALEEANMELANDWAEPQVGTEPHNSPPMVIGSIRLAVRVRTLTPPCMVFSTDIIFTSHWIWNVANRLHCFIDIQSRLQSRKENKSAS